MKYAIPVFLYALMSTGCFLPAYKPVAAADSTAVTAIPVEEAAKGIYKGDFGGSPIFITINYANGNHVAGYNIHKGLRRNLHGELQQQGDTWILALSEPGDHPFDGQFRLVFDKAFGTGQGKWSPLNNNSLTEKTFNLQKMPPAADGGIVNNTYAGQQCDISFMEDGNCTLHYYDKINDSTFAPQLNTVRGTWEQHGDTTVAVNWQPNEQFRKRNSTFALHFEDMGGQSFCVKVEGEGFEFDFQP